MKNFVIHKGQAIAKNSEAYRLWEEKKWKELDKHLAEVHRKAVERGEIRQ